MKAKIWDNLVKKRIYPVKMCVHLQTYLDYIPEYWRNLRVWTRDLWKITEIKGYTKGQRPNSQKGRRDGF